ncbi:hypothetical protein BDZ97DRAFT_1802474 [Flammula alnicola]|nr:hypothetical protein BDZ97DRAFT_1859756 [Flammula alnicola]KAF8967628.1 hypothetical protein BDZ97DRAFT_1802474 [Flammula alnicola]
MYQYDQERQQWHQRTYNEETQRQWPTTRRYSSNPKQKPHHHRFDARWETKAQEQNRRRWDMIMKATRGAAAFIYCWRSSQPDLHAVSPPLPPRRGAVTVSPTSSLHLAMARRSCVATQLYLRTRLSLILFPPFFNLM